MRFLFFVPRYHTNLHFQVKALEDKGHKVSLLSLYKGGSEDYSVLEPQVLGYSKFFLFLNRIFNPNGGKLIKNSFELKYAFPPIISLWRFIREENPDVFVIKNIESVFSILAFIFALLLGKKAVFLLQIPKYRRKPKSGSVSLAGFFGASVVTPVLGNPGFENKNDNLFYVPFAIEIEDFDKKYFKDEKINILSVGKFQERKDQLLLVKALERLRSKYPLSLTLLGQDDETEYKKRLVSYIETAGLNDLVHIKEHAEWRSALDLYKDFDIFILPGYLESASYSILEAMSKKLAVISSDDNGTACYVEEGKNGFIFKHKNLEDLVRALDMLLEDRELINKAGEESFRLAREKHSLDYFYDLFMKALPK